MQLNWNYSSWGPPAIPPPNPPFQGSDESPRLAASFPASLPLSRLPRGPSALLLHPKPAKGLSAPKQPRRAPPLLGKAARSSNNPTPSFCLSLMGPRTLWRCLLLAQFSSPHSTLSFPQWLHHSPEGPQPPSKNRCQASARLGNYSQGRPSINGIALMTVPALPEEASSSQKMNRKRLRGSGSKCHQRPTEPPSRDLLCRKKLEKWGAFNSTLGTIQRPRCGAMQAKAWPLSLFLGAPLLTWLRSLAHSSWLPDGPGSAAPEVSSSSWTSASKAWVLFRSRRSRFSTSKSRWPI